MISADKLLTSYGDSPWSNSEKGEYVYLTTLELKQKYKWIRFSKIDSIEMN